MSKTIARVFIAPLVAFVLACTGLAFAATTPDQAHAATAIAKCPQVTTQAPSAKAAKKAFVGKYKLVKMVDQNGKITGKSDLAKLEKSGYVFLLNLKSNGKAVVNLNGVKFKGAWKAQSKKRGTITSKAQMIKLNGQTVPLAAQKVSMKKSGKKITLSQAGSGAVLTYKKM